MGEIPSSIQDEPQDKKNDDKQLDEAKSKLQKIEQPEEKRDLEEPHSPMLMSELVRDYRTTSEINKQFRQNREKLFYVPPKKEALKVFERIHESSFWKIYDDVGLEKELENIEDLITNPRKGIRRTPAKIEWLKKVADAIELEIDARKAQNPND